MGCIFRQATVASLAVTKVHFDPASKRDAQPWRVSGSLIFRFCQPVDLLLCRYRAAFNAFHGAWLPPTPHLYPYFLPVCQPPDNQNHRIPAVPRRVAKHELGSRRARWPQW